MDLEKLIGPYPGSNRVDSKTSDFAQYELVTGPVDSAGTAKITKTQMLEGKTVQIHYENAKERSEFEIFANYRDAVAKLKFKTLYTCIDAACFADGKPSNNVTEVPRGIGYFPQAGTHYLAAKLSTPEGDLYLALHVQQHRTDMHYTLVKAMETGLVQIDAAAMKADIDSEGHVAVYGIVFDSGKAVMKPESSAAIGEIVKLLKNDAALKIHVVGHTDSAGALDANLGLSRRRAEAVVAELTKKHGIAPARLRADGVGPLCPVATNGTDPGKAKNRRVDLVKQ